MTLAVGIDVAKEFHWFEIKVAETGQTFASARVDNTPVAIQALIDRIHGAEADHGPATVGIDVLGGIAGLLDTTTPHGLDIRHWAAPALYSAVIWPACHDDSPPLGEEPDSNIGTDPSVGSAANQLRAPYERWLPS